MARPLRLEHADALYHITSRGNEQRPIFYDDTDRLMFLNFLAQAIHRFGWSLTAWVLMTNHFHLVLQTPQPNLSRGMHWLNGSYAAWFNARHKRSGHLFQGRFKSFLIEKETYLCRVLRYVVFNPVRANMVAHPRDYRWSSYRASAGLDEAPDWLDLAALLGGFDLDPARAQHLYREFIENMPAEERPWDEVSNGIYLGSDAWAKMMRAIVESRPRSSDHPKTQRAVGRPKMHAIVAAVAKVAEQSADHLRRSRGGSLRRLVAWLGWHEGLATLSAIAAVLRIRSEGHVSRMIRRCEAEFALDGNLLAHLDLATALLRA